MASVNLINVDQITAAYESIIRNDCSWLLLKFSDVAQCDDLSLLGTGTGLPQLKADMSSNPNQVLIAFYHEGIQVRPGYILINYIPHAISAVKKARIMIHSRRVGALFTIEHATLTVDHLSNLTPSSIHQAILDPDTLHVIQLDRSISTPLDIMSMRQPGPEPLPIRKSSSDAQTSLSPPKPNILSQFLRRKAPQRASEEHEDPEPSTPEENPPPPPPKDKSKYLPGIPPATPPSHRSHPFSVGASSASASNSPPQISVEQTWRDSAAEFGMVRRPTSFSSDDAVLVDHSEVEFGGGLKSSLFCIPLAQKWSTNAMVVADPEERARRRKLVQNQREMEEQLAIREEEERQLQLKFKKEQQTREEMEREAERRALLQREIARATEERRKREQLEKMEEENKKIELEEKKRVAKMKRLEEHRRLEEWRKEQTKRADEAAKREDDLRCMQRVQRRRKIQDAAVKVKNNPNAEDLTTGWVTIQVSDAIAWRRRYYKCVGTILFLYRAHMDSSQVSDRLELRDIKNICEWYDGYEELKAIPYSFAIEFKDHNHLSWSVFTDSEEEKDRLLGLLAYAAGL